jgi:FMN phosphatase YigB (HAD superfamily)
LTIKAVLFDLGNTLVKYDYGSSEEVFQRILTSLGFHRSLEEIKKAFLNAEREAEDINLPSSLGKVKCEEYWYRWNYLVLKHLQMEENEELPRIISFKLDEFRG